MAIYFDDLTEGQVFTSVGRTIAEADIVAFAGVSGDFNQLHTNDEWVVEHTPFKGRIAHGLLILSIGAGLRTPGLDDLEVIAFLETSRRFLLPVYPGDTVHVVNRVDGLRPSRSDPGRGVATFGIEIRNQRGEVAQEGRDILMVVRRTEAS